MVKQLTQRLELAFRVITQRNLDVLDQLEKDHIRIEMLLMQWKLIKSEKFRERLLGSIRQEFSVHSTLEESLFYPACEKFKELESMISNSYLEHKEVKAELKAISSLSQTSDKAATQMRKVTEAIEGHVSKEENDLFPRVRKLMRPAQLQRLAREYLQAKKEIQQKAKVNSKRAA